MNFLEHYGVIPVDFMTLVSLLENYKSPRDKISRLEKEGKLIRLKKGLYVISPEIHKKTLSQDLMANHLYGPSYVSLESALSHYNLIPERVYSTRSMTTKRGKTFITPLGRFDYISVKEEYFRIGICQEMDENNFAWLTASPEKALCDMVVSTAGLRLQSVKAAQQYFEEDLRIDFSSAKELNTEIIRQCIETGVKKTELIQIYKFLKA